MLPLRILSDYRLEFRMEKNRALYNFGIYFAPVCRLLIVVLILLAVTLSPFFAIGIPVCIALSVLSDNIAKKCVYTLEYSWHDGVFTITHITLDGEEKRLERLDCGSVLVKRTDILPDETIDYSAKDNCDERIKVLLECERDGKKIFITPDKYMYALIAERREYGLSR